jgi:hypothetical protein
MTVVYTWLYAFSTSALDGGEWSPSSSGRCTSGQIAPVTREVGAELIWTFGGREKFFVECSGSVYVIFILPVITDYHNILPLI